MEKKETFKERKRYCKICKKITWHVTAFIGLSFTCINEHFGITKCHSCGAELDKETIKIAKALGATVVCKKCKNLEH